MEIVRDYLKSPNTIDTAQNLLQQLSLSEIVALIKRGTEDDVCQAIQRIFQIPEIFQSMMSTIPISDFRTFGKSKALRTIIADNLHRYPVADYFPLVNDVPELVAYLCELLSDAETDISQFALKTLERVPKINHELVMSPEIIAFIKKKATGTNSVVQLRFLELVIRLANQHEEIFRQYLEAGLVNEALSCYSSSDILVKLASIEVIEQFGNSEHGCQFLLNSDVLQMATQEIRSPETDEYTIFKLAVLFAKLQNYSPELFDQRYQTLVHKMLNSGNITAQSHAITALCHMMQTQQGVANALSSEAMTRSWLGFADSRNDELKIAFYTSLMTLLQNASPMDERVYNFFRGLPRPTSKNTLFMDILASPFKALEEYILKTSLALIRFDWGVNYIYSDPEFVQYMTTRDPKNSSEIANLKYDINRAAIQSNFIADPLVKETVEKYLKQGVFAPAFAFSDETVTENI